MDAVNGTDELESLKAQLIAEKERRKKLNAEVLSLRTVVSEDVARLEADARQAMAEVEARDQRIEALEATLAAQKDEIQVTSALLSAKESALETALTDLRHASFARDCAAGDVDEALAQARELGQDLQASKAREAELQALVTSLQGKLHQLESLLSAAEAARADAEAAGEAAVEAADELSQRLVAEEHARQAAEGRANVLEAQVAELSSSLQLTESSLAEEGRLSRSLQLELEATQARARQADMDRDQAWQEVSMTRQQCQELQQQLQEARQRLAEAEAPSRQPDQALVPHGMAKDTPPLDGSRLALAAPVDVESLLSTYRSDLATAKAFGMELLAANRRLQQELEASRLGTGARAGAGMR